VRTMRPWGDEELLPISQLIREKLPVERDRSTWDKWFRLGCPVNGERMPLPQITIGGVIHSSVPAIREFFNDVATGDLPERRRKVG
jgi:hypothetical protein